MNNKYYTPELEEFHIGFEYESSTDGINWEQYTYSLDCWSCASGMEIAELKYTNPSLLFRVKYLDKEDIESLWGKDGILGEFNIAWHPDYNTTVLIYRTSIANTVFRGFIKNKSELKKLIQQLNII